MNASSPDERSSPAANDADSARVSTVHPIALTDLQDVDGPGESLLPPANPLHHVSVRLQIVVGEVSMTIGELLGIQQHRVLALDRAVDQPVDVLLEGRVVARGQLVAVDDRFAIRITQVPTPLRT